MGLKVQQIQRSKQRITEMEEVSIWKKEIVLFGQAFSAKKKEQFYTELSVLLTSGIRLKDALVLISESQKKEKDGLRFRDMADGIVAGQDFSVIIENDKDFGKYEGHSIKIGEQTGSLELVTTALADFYNRKNEQRRTIISALTYPIIVLSTAVLAVVFMLRFVVPMFQDIFRQNNVELPKLTKAVIAMSDWVGTYGVWMLVIVLLGVSLRKFYTNQLWFRKWKDRFLLRLPIIGPFIRLAQIARLTQAISLLISAKVSIPESIRLAKDMVEFYPLEKALDNVQANILRGQSLSDSLKAEAFFDNKMIALVRVAEETNQTAFVFGRLNEQYGKELMQRSKLFSTTLEPAIILIVGILVATILVAMYLPMFALGNVLH